MTLKKINMKNQIFHGNLFNLIEFLANSEDSHCYMDGKGFLTVGVCKPSCGQKKEKEKNDS
jgi:hypothetical protein